MDRVYTTSYNPEENLQERLTNVLKYVDAVADYAGVEDVFSKVAQIHDHKGHLTVVWNTTPSNQEKSFFDRAWKSHFGDGTDEITHTDVDEEDRDPTITSR